MDRRCWKVVVHKHEGNNYANRALTYALALRGGDRPNWSCCHIWGVDDPTFASSNVVVQDPRYYSCVADMVLLPTPLKAFTDVMSEVKAMLRGGAFHTFGWRCGHEALINVDTDAATAHPAYLANRPRRRDDPPPRGTVSLTDTIARDARKRLERIRHDLATAGQYHPRKSVIDVLAYCDIDG